jgi:hypothetical protein
MNVAFCAARPEGTIRCRRRSLYVTGEDRVIGLSGALGTPGRPAQAPGERRRRRGGVRDEACPEPRPVTPCGPTPRVTATEPPIRPAPAGRP